MAARHTHPYCTPSSGSRFGKDTTGLDVSLLAIANLGYAVIHAEVNL